MSKRFITFILLGLIVVGVAEWDLHKRVLDPVRKLDRFWVDFCLGNSGSKIGEPSITMVRITDEYKPVSLPGGTSEQTSNVNSSLTRLDYATCLYSLGKVNAKSVAFLPTPVFESDAVLNARSIYPLRDTSLQLPRMTVATIVSAEGAPANPAQAVNYQAIQAKGDTSSIMEIKTTVVPADPDVMVNADPAFKAFQSANADSPDFGDRPRVQLVARQGENVVPGFILTAIAKEANIGFDEIIIDLDKGLIEVGNLYKIPIDESGTMALPSHGGLSHAMYDVTIDDEGKEIRDYRFASLKVSDVPMAVKQENDVAKVVFGEMESKFASLAENLVLVGFDRIADRNITTEDDDRLSPMTAVARAIATIQSKRHTVRWPVWLRTIGYGLVFLIGFILLRMGRVSVLAIPFVALFFFAALVLVFSQTLSWTPPAALIGLFAIMFLIALFSKNKPKSEADDFDPETVIS